MEFSRPEYWRGERSLQAGWRAGLAGRKLQCADTKSDLRGREQERVGVGGGAWLLWKNLEGGLSEVTNKQLQGVRMM